MEETTNLKRLSVSCDPFSPLLWFSQNKAAIPRMEVQKSLIKDEFSLDRVISLNVTNYLNCPQIRELLEKHIKGLEKYQNYLKSW